MTNREKLKEMFPNTIFIYQKEEDKTKAIVCSDEWLDMEYKEPTPKNDLAVDCISRAEAIKCLECDFDITGKENMKTVVNYINLAHDKIVNLPSVTPIRPKGHWIPIYQGDEIIDYRCSECEFGNTFGRGTFGMDFCPRCGADMREVEE